MATTSAGKHPHGHDNESIGTSPSSTQLPSADGTHLERLPAERNPYRATANPAVANVPAERNPYRATANPAIANVLAERNPSSATANPSISSIPAEPNLYSATVNPFISGIIDDHPEILSTHWHPAVPATGAAAQPAAAEPGAASC